MTKFSFEVPLAHLDEFDQDQDFLFTLSFLYKDWRYLSYVSNSDKEIWIDNSYNETKQACQVEDMLHLFNCISPNLVISPDHAEWGHQKMLEVWQEMTKDLNKEDVSIIVHHPDWIGYYRSWGVEHFCVPYDFRYCTLSKLNRFSGCHFLGLVSVKEISIAKPPSCDTSMPIKLALIGQTMDEWIQGECKHIHTDPEFFNLKMTSKEIKLAKENIRRLRELCQE